MRRAGDIMKELGFREDAPESVQKAFIKNLVRAAYGAEVEDLQEYRESQSRQKPHSEEKQAHTNSIKKAKAVNQRDKKISPGPNNEETQLSFQFMKKNG